MHMVVQFIYPSLVSAFLAAILILPTSLQLAIQSYPRPFSAGYFTSHICTYDCSCLSIELYILHLALLNFILFLPKYPDYSYTYV